MAAPSSPADRPKTSRPRLRLLLRLALAVPAVVVLASWWFTEPLADRPTGLPAALADSATPSPPPDLDAMPACPEGRLAGEAANQLILASARRSAARLARVDCYTAILRKEERIGGVLSPETVMAMKVRNRPFAIYLKFLVPTPGKEVVYAEGHRDNKLIAHKGDWTRKLVPRLAVAPDSLIAMADNRHPVTEAGLAHLADKLLYYREMDIGDPGAVTVLDRTVDAQGRPWLRAVHTHHLADGTRPFARVEILYDPATQYPLRISSYDWPAPGHAGDLDLAERYAYDDLKLDAPLTAADFDPANPEYAFMRF